MKLISWNVIGIRACMGMGFLEVLNEGYLLYSGDENAGGAGGSSDGRIFSILVFR